MKRHAMSTMGLMLSVAITPVDVQDRDGFMAWRFMIPLLN
jgi:hypothetical protein